MQTILRYFIKDKLIINLITLAVVCFGLFHLTKIMREVFPDTESDVMMVRITYPGASAEDVELNALIPVEDVLEDIAGIKEFSSICYDSSGRIWIELDGDVEDLQPVKDEIYRKISLSNVTGISSDVEAITVQEMNPKLKTIVRLALVPKDASASKRELFEMADALERILGKSMGVSSITKSGYYDRQIHIDVDPVKMEEEYVSLSEIVSSIKNRNVRSTGGTIQSVDRERNVVTIGEFSDPLEVGEVIVRSGFEQKHLKVKDIAAVNDDFEDAGTYLRANGGRAVVFSIKKKETVDIIRTVDALKKTIKQNESLYAGKFRVDVLADDSQSIRSLISVVIGNAVLGFVLVIITLLVFLDYKTSFWTAFSIPLCLLMSIAFLNLTGSSINTITLGAIITVLGMLVDDAIVVAETVYVKREEGLAPLEAAYQGIKEVVAPVAVTIITTIIAFVPLMMVGGRMGKFIYTFPIVIAVTLTVSFLEAVFILPNHLAHSTIKQITQEKRWYIALFNGYKELLKKALALRYPVLGVFVLLLFFSIAISAGSMRNFKLMRDDNSEQFYLELVAPVGVTLDEMEAMTAKVEQKLMEKIPRKEFLSVISTIGEHTHNDLEGVHKNWATVDVQLVTKTERKRSTQQIMASLREELSTKKMSGFETITFNERRFGPSSGDEINLKIISNSAKQSAAAESEILEFLKKTNGIKDVDTDNKEGDDEIRIRFDYDKLAQYDMSVSNVAATVRTAYEGAKATYVQYADTRLEFYVRVKDSEMLGTDYLLNLLIPNNSGALIRLSQVAHVEEGKARSSILHFNGERTVTITGNTDGTITPMQAGKILMEKVKSIKSKYPAVSFTTGGELEETNTALLGLGGAFVVVIIGIYLILLFLFRSVGHPLIVMSVIPFGLIGVLLAFYAHGIKLSFMAIIGIIGLCGVVVNDSIIMVEFINRVFQNMHGRKKNEIMETIADGAAQRLRPILLTTITTVAGLMPTVYGIGGSVGTLVPTVMAMAYGLLFSTLLTLLFVPCLYMIGMDIKESLSTLIIGKSRLRN